ncbi:MAG: DUF6377 domain-containing protein [Bacteroidota bacterium]
MDRLAWVLILLLGSVKGVSQDNDSLITLLKQEIEQRDIYVQQKLERIESLKLTLSRIEELTLPQQFELYNNLYHQYKTFIYDSAFHYGQKLIQTAYKLGDKSKIDYARVKIGFILISSGMFKETFDSLNIVAVENLPDSSRRDYFRLLARAYSDLNIYNKDSHYRRYYSKLETSYMDSALRYCAPESYYYYYLTAVRNLHNENYQVAVNTIEKLLTKQKLTYPELAVNYFDLGNSYKALGRMDKTIECTLMSSLSDIRAATKETAAMHTLAKLLYEMGDVKNAYIFIKQALDDAEFYGARQRKVEISSILPVIASAELNNSESQRRLWLGFGVGVSILSALVMVFAIIIFKQLKKLKAAELKIKEANSSLQEMNHKLLEANKIKEEYLGYYFNVTTDYLSKIEDFKKSIDHKLTAKKFEDIRSIVNKINHKNEREELYGSFDRVFLKLFPDFVPTFNSYFSPEDRFVQKDNQLLNTELRIFALIRMGINDTDKIARILDYSVNTIYAYKTRVKSKSTLPNDQFEDKIMEIRSV